MNVNYSSFLAQNIPAPDLMFQKLRHIAPVFLMYSRSLLSLDEFVYSSLNQRIFNYLYRVYININVLKNNCFQEFLQIMFHTMGVDP